MTQPPDPLAPQFPPTSPTAPLPYYGYVAAPKLPGGAKALAIIAIVLGAIGTLGICAIPMYVTNIIPNPAIDVIRNDRGLLSLTVGSIAAGSIAAIFLLIAGIQCVQMKPSGRPMIVVVAAIMLVLAVIGQIISFTYTLPKFRAIAAQHPSDPIMQSMATSGRMGVVFGLLYIIYYGLVIRTFSSPSIRALFNASPTPINPPLP